jgi:hypothetical protein
MIGSRAVRFPVIMTVAFILAQFCGISWAAELGRLFTTPEERSQLEKLRNPSAETSQLPPAADPAIAEQGPRNNDITIKGIVFRKNGRSTIWINNSHRRARQLQINADKNNAGDVLIKTPDDKTFIRLRPEEMHHPHITQ